MKTKFFSRNGETHKNPVFLIAIAFITFYLALGAVLRVALMLNTPTTLDVARVMSVGLLSDMGVGILLTLPLALSSRRR